MTEFFLLANPVGIIHFFSIGIVIKYSANA